MAKHADMEILLATYRDLDDQQRAEVDAHADGCDRCNELRRTFRKQDELFADLGTALQRRVDEILDGRPIDYAHVVEVHQARQRARAQRLRRAGQGALIISGLLLMAYLLSRLLIGWMPAPEVIEEPTPLVPTPTQPTPAPTPGLDSDQAVWTGIAASLALEEQAYLPDSTVEKDDVMQGQTEWMAASVYSSPWTPPWYDGWEIEPQLLVIDRIEHVHNDLALVRIATRSASALEHQRHRYEWRVYRQTEKGWLWSEPDAELWGEERSIKTDNFHLHYRALDAAVVEEVAILLQQSFSRYLDLVGVEDQEVRTIRFDPTATMRNMGLYTFILPSPYFIYSIDGLTVPQVIARENLIHATRNVFHRQVVKYGDPFNPLSEGLIDWAIKHAYTFPTRDDVERIALVTAMAKHELESIDMLIEPRNVGTNLFLSRNLGRELFTYIEQEYGFETVLQILRGEVPGEGWTEALETVTGLSIDELDARWRKWMLIRHSPTEVTRN